MVRTEFADTSASGSNASQADDRDHAEWILIGDVADEAVAAPR